MERTIVYIYECHISGESHLEDLEYFDTLKQAKSFIEEFNLVNSIKNEANWYMKAVL